MALVYTLCEPPVSSLFWRVLVLPSFVAVNGVHQEFEGREIGLVNSESAPLFLLLGADNMTLSTLHSGRSGRCGEPDLRPHSVKSRQ